MRDYQFLSLLTGFLSLRVLGVLNKISTLRFFSHGQEFIVNCLSKLTLPSDAMILEESKNGTRRIERPIGQDGLLRVYRCRPSDVNEFYLGFDMCLLLSNHET